MCFRENNIIDKYSNGSTVNKVDMVFISFSGLLDFMNIGTSKLTMAIFRWVIGKLIFCNALNNALISLE